MTTPTTYNDIFQEEDKPLDIRRIIGIARRYWVLLSVFPILCVGLAFLNLYSTSNQYKIVSKIIIKKDDKQKGSKSNVAFDVSSLFSASASNTADEVEILKSRILMAETLNELKINPIIYLKGKLKDEAYYKDSPIIVDTFSLSEHAIERNESINLEIKIIDNQNYQVLNNNEKIKAQFGAPFKIDNCFFVIKKIKEVNSDMSFLININTIESLSKQYLKKLNVTPIEGDVNNSNSNAIEISIEDELPKRGVDIINKLIEVYNRFGIEDKNSGDKNALKFIEERVDLLNGEVKSGDLDIEAFKKSQGIIAETETGISFTLDKLGTSDSKITDLEIRKAVLNSLLESVKKQSSLNDFSLMPTNLVDNTSSVGIQIIDYNKMILERLRLLRFAQKENPSVVVLENQIQNTRSLIQENINTSLSNLQQEINLSLTKFKSEKSDASQELRKTPSKERGLLEITRLKNLKESIYLFLLQKREEIALSLATTVENARTLDPALCDLKPVSPQKKKTVLIALLIGLFVPVAIIYILLWLKDTVESEDEIKKLTSTPFLGYVTENDDNKKHIVVEQNSRTPAAETFRLLRSNLQFMMAATDNKTVLITSSMMGEGKSFITLNLGISIAMTNKKTIILGFDLRKPKLIEYLRNKTNKIQSQGLSNYLVGDVSVESIIQASEVNPSLFYISSGPIPPNPAELITQERTDKLFEYLRQEFDFIIIDSPPVGMVVDAVLLSKYASTTLYITRYGVTKKAQLSIIDQLYKEGKLPNPSIVLNAVKMIGGYGYGYGYGYGRGYYGEERKKTSLDKIKSILKF